MIFDRNDRGWTQVMTRTGTPQRGFLRTSSRCQREDASRQKPSLVGRGLRPGREAPVDFSAAYHHHSVVGRRTPSLSRQLGEQTPTRPHLDFNPGGVYWPSASRTISKPPLHSHPDSHVTSRRIRTFSLQKRNERPTPTHPLHSSQRRSWPQIICSKIPILQNIGKLLFDYFIPHCIWSAI